MNLSTLLSKIKALPVVSSLPAPSAVLPLALANWKPLAIGAAVGYVVARVV